jgi:hypothetical protein
VLCGCSTNRRKFAVFVIFHYWGRLTRLLGRLPPFCVKINDSITATIIAPTTIASDKLVQTVQIRDQDIAVTNW